MSVAEKLLFGEAFIPSENIYDWLGHGIYFWESNPRRGIEFYKESEARDGRSGDDAAVVGAVIDLGHCLDLLSSRAIDALTQAHADLVEIMRVAEKEMPKNVGGKDKLLRELDCEVVNHLHRSRRDGGLLKFDTVRGVFTEDEPAYHGSGFLKKSHIQIAVCDAAFIKGVFRVKPEDL